MTIFSASVFFPSCSGGGQEGEETAGSRSAFLIPHTQRDSVLVADQLDYGFILNEVEAGTGLQLPDYSEGFCDGVEVLTPWRIDTVEIIKGKKSKPELMDIKGSVSIASFDEGEYHLPPVVVVKSDADGRTDTLVFEAKTLTVKTIPIDTATFEMHDIKGQIQYPVEFREVLPYLGGALLLALIVILAIVLVRKYGKKDRERAAAEPAHIVALRKLDAFRGDSLWVPEKQKLFYSGVTDALREYMVSRYGVAAMEMTTKEIFKDLKDKDIPQDIFMNLQELFEKADFVKFAKYVASNEENSGVLPLAVRFVTTTYQEELETESDEKSGNDIAGGSREVTDVRDKQTAVRAEQKVSEGRIEKEA